ncbi:spore germination protein GerW family protein [Clostridium aestuarii]|uniref:Spore germination protein GerW family protein n=1 Tax=Clostridium aestuarii TaxID=338193 RepID=A0ABT4CY01_9CLOT|nr:spore germination protein GerW family protein [Clostridium aestuarii]MCY6483841.1 spore germination protein GerW family protein [Clostridium aestuarii]
MQDIQNVDTLFTDLQNLMKTESFMGAPVNVADKTLVPVISVTVGYGSGTSKKPPVTTNEGTGLGLGAKIKTNAVVVINKDSVSMLPVNAKGNVNNLPNDNNIMTTLVDKVPEMINNFKQGAQPQNMGQNQQQNQAQNQQQNMAQQPQNKAQNQQKQNK